MRAPPPFLDASQTSPRSLAGRRILLFLPYFFGYEHAIVEELRARGAEVDFLPDRPFTTAVMAAVTRFARSAVMPAAYRFYRTRLDQLGRDYSDVLVINGQTMPVRLLHELRGELPRAKFTFYIWDSIRIRPRTVAILPLFDECFSFEPEAARDFGLRLRPLFYVPGFDQMGDPSSIRWDMSFVGTAHTDRYRTISLLDRSLALGVRRLWYLYLQAPWVYHAYRLRYPHFRQARREEFKFEPLPGWEVREIFRASRMIVDVENPRQTGLTIRTFETLGAGKKLVTTNAAVRDYDFYDPANIHIIDRKAPKVPDSFLESPMQSLSADIRYRYSLSGWIDDLLAAEPRQ